MPLADAKRVRLLTALVLAATFAAGAIAGAGFQRWRAPRPPPPPYLEGLDLSPEQHERARAILDKYRPELDAILRETRPKVRAVQDRMDQELRALLTPAQQAEAERRRATRRGPPRGAVPHEGPPREALDACREQTTGAECHFTNRRGDSVSGVCRNSPEGLPPLACAPR